MKQYNKFVPEGVRDILLDECRARREAQRRFSEIFTCRGYQEVMTPGLEFYDLFTLPGAALRQREMYKSTDCAGRLLVFRPDSTLPIARMAAARLQGHRQPLRLFYSQTVYRSWPELSGKSHESPQMGVELLGASGIRADLEVICTAVECLRAITQDFHLELGHAGLFQLLVSRLEISPEQQEEIRATIEAKNYGALGELLDPLGDRPEAEAIRRLPRLFGGEEVLAQAESWGLKGEGVQPLDYLRELYGALKQLGLGHRLMVDLGLVQRNDYYTGIVFGGYVGGSGSQVLTGGRYDRLCGKFGQPMPAVGFGMDMGSVAGLLEAQLPPVGGADVLVHGEKGQEITAQREMMRLTAMGLRCESSVWESQAEAEAYAKEAGISQIIVVGETLKTIDLGGKDHEAVENCPH